MLGLPPLRQPLERPSCAGCLHQFPAASFAVTLRILQPPALVEHPAAQVGEDPRGVLHLAQGDHGAASVTIGAQTGDNRVVSLPGTLEIRPAVAHDTLGAGEAPLGLLLLPAPQVQRSLQRELILRHWLSPWTRRLWWLGRLTIAAAGEIFSPS
jgi:hypothetical protein